MKTEKRLLSGILSLIMMASLTACGNAQTLTKGTDVSETAEVQVSEEFTMPEGLPAAEDMFTKRDLKQEYEAAEAVKIDLSSDSISVPGASLAGNTLTIQKEGIYVLSGKLEGSVVVNAEDAKVQIVLNNATIKADNTAAIYVKNAGKVFLTCVGNNTVESDGTFEADGTTSVDGAIYAKCNLVLNGAGSLNVQSAENGIVCKDNLKICGATVMVSAEKHGLQAKNSVRIHSGNITITSGSDGIHCENKNKPEKGYVYMAGGDLTITAGSDGIDCIRELVLAGGNITITAEKDGVRTQSGLVQAAGNYQITAKENQIDIVTAE